MYSYDRHMQKITIIATLIRDPAAEINTIRDTGEREEDCSSSSVIESSEHISVIYNRRQRSESDHHPSFQ
ncbi:hypothetical protein R3I93_016889 [Phoxinus phoxinus]|uniref:Uncharacterized protein n=1 Tax=Phoxinus phoxinus TaxID=58324 RepID=A0AAN9GWV2_9TELE